MPWKDRDVDLGDGLSILCRGMRIGSVTGGADPESVVARVCKPLHGSQEKVQELADPQGAMQESFRLAGGVQRTEAFRVPKLSRSR